MRRFAAAAGFLLLCLSGSAGAGRLALPDAHLVLTSDRDGVDRIYAVNADGTRLSIVTRGRVGDPILAAPQGGRIVFGRGLRMYVVDGNGRNLRNLGAGYPLAISPDGKAVAFAFDDGGAGVARLDHPARRRLTHAPRYRDDVVAWSPDSKWLLIIRPGPPDSDFASRLLRVDAEHGRSRSLMRGDIYGAFWSRRGTIAVARNRRDGQEEIDIIDPARPSKLRVAAQAREERIVGWSPDGRRLAFETTDAEGDALRTFDLRTGSVSVVLSSATDDVAWSPRSDALAAAVPGSKEFDIVAVDGTVRTRGAVFGGAGGFHWAADGSRLAFETGNGIYVERVDGRGSRRIIYRGNNLLLGWGTGRVAERLARAPDLPPSEVLAANELRSRAPIREISADGDWSALLVGSSRIDCHHVVAWHPSSTRFLRFSVPAPCDWNVGWHALSLAGTTITWYTSEYCGNYCYVCTFKADLEAPGSEECSEAFSDDVAVVAEPRDETHRGVAMSFLDGTIHLRRVSDGATRDIRPPGGAVDAAFENTGLFYAYNLPQGADRGRAVFVPFDQLFTR